MKLPDWKEIPDIELYSDQLIYYVNKSLDFNLGYNLTELSASMVNNYVKHKYLDKPVKKKYSKDQVSNLILITLFKIIFPIQDISRLIEFCNENSSMQETYSNFVSYWNENIKVDGMSDVLVAYADTIKAYINAVGVYKETCESEVVSDGEK